MFRWFKDLINPRYAHFWDVPELLLAILSEVRQMNSAIEALKVAVEAETTVQQSAITLLNSIHQQLEDAKTDPVALQGVIDSIKANTDALSAAVVANTDAPPA